ncbi:MAG: restriction endonuclease subunit S [Ignavibacteria bacterium]|nr:restriction endonuclease subunit S [Ignavibacteria bacterium]
MKFLNESEYKLNDCKWLNRLPDTWDSKRLKYVSKVKPSNVDKKTEENEIPVSLCNYNEVYKNDFIDSYLTFMEASASSEEIAKFQIIKDDVIITKDSETPEEIALPAYVVENLPNTLCGYHLSLIRTDKNVLSGSYLFRLFQSKQFNAQFTVAANGITRFGLDTYSIKNAVVALPSLPEQQTIAKFLDYKTTQIDELIEKKEQLLKLLEEKRIALITNAVTGKLSTSPPWRGLRGGSQLDKHNNVTMKPSGISWLGNIPSNWYVCQLKYVAKISYGIGGEIDKSITKGVRLLSLPNVSKEGDLLLDEENYIELSEDEKESLLLKEGDLLFNWRNGSSDHLGKTVIINSSDEFTHVSFLLRIRFKKKFDSRYFKYLLHGFRMTRYFSSSKAGVNNTFNLSELSELRIIVPTKYDQKNISDYLDLEIDRILKLKSTIINAIEKLKEYRTSLITSAVTGKIDLRNWSSPTSLSFIRACPDSSGRGTEGEVKDDKLS